MDRYHQIFSDSLLTRTPAGKVRPGTQGWVYHFSPAHTLRPGFLDGVAYREGKSDTPGLTPKRMLGTLFRKGASVGQALKGPPPGHVMLLENRRCLRAAPDFFLVLEDA